MRSRCGRPQDRGGAQPRREVVKGIETKSTEAVRFSLLCGLNSGSSNVSVVCDDQRGLFWPYHHYFLIGR
jgi:hypothetical protein